MENKPANITKPSIIRLARRAGVKNISDDCYVTINELITDMLSELAHTIIVVNSENRKTIMPDVVYQALCLKGHHIAKSKDLGTSVFT